MKEDFFWEYNDSLHLRGRSPARRMGGIHRADRHAGCVLRAAEGPRPRGALLVTTRGGDERHQLLAEERPGMMEPRCSHAP